LRGPQGDQHPTATVGVIGRHENGGSGGLHRCEGLESDDPFDCVQPVRSVRDDGSP
jgi:hypothetical protein